MKEYLVCTPGPVQLSPDVRAALSRAIMPHYGEEWIRKVYSDVQEKLHRVFQTRGRLFILPSSGSGAIETAFCSLSSKKQKVAVFRNGFFGDRMLQIAHQYFTEVRDCPVEYSRPITPDIVEDFLKSHPDVSMVGIVHGETSAGVCNDIREIGKVVKRGERIFIVDAVATLGGMNVEVDNWQIDFCLSASQKGLGAPPGLGFVSVSEQGFAAMPARDAIPGWYHNLKVWRDSVDEWGAWHPYPVTLPVNLFYALQAALKELLEEGLAERFARHKRVAGYFRERIRELGNALFCTAPGAEMDTVTAFMLPEGFSSPEMIEYLKAEHSTIISGGHGQYKDRMSRTGHMGYNAREEAMDAVISGIALFMDERTGK